MYYISPSVGSIEGGTEVIISGEDFVDTSCDDKFDGIEIDPFKWSVDTIGIGSSVSVADGQARLAVGSAIWDYAKITSLVPFSDIDTSVEFDIKTDTSAAPPSGSVNAVRLRLEIEDSGNYIQIVRKVGGAYGDRYEASVFLADDPVGSAFLPAPSASGVLRIIRTGSTVRLLAGDTEALSFTGFPLDPAELSILAGNQPTSYAIITAIDNFRVRPMVTFGTVPMLDAVAISPDRIQGTTPPGERIATVPLQFATSAGNLPVFDAAFSYDDAAEFRILSLLDGTVAVMISNDPILRNLREGRPGFLR